MKRPFALADQDVASLSPLTVHKTIWQWLKDLGLFLQCTGILIPLIFLLFMFWQDPFTDIGDFDYDEGINLMKALLYSQNYTLYGDIWSDQPPLFTIMLSGWFAIGGESVASARVLVALFSALLLWGFYLTLRNSVSTFAATAATLLLVLSAFYIRLSGAVMIGLPALALAMLSIMFLLLGKQRWWTLIVSAVIMAMALQIKLFVAALFPAIFFHLLFAQTSITAPPLRQQVRRFLVWLALVVASFLLLSVYFHAWDVEMLLSTHFGAQTRSRLVFAEESRKFLVDLLRQHPVYLALALLGAGYAGWQRNRQVILPFAWFVTVLIGFMFHRPLWYHHIMLLTMPLIWLGAFSLEAWAQAVKRLCHQPPPRQLRRAIFLGSTAIALCAILFYYPSPLTQRLDQASSLYRPLYIWEIAQQLRIDAQLEPGFVFTDRPFYAFQAGLPVAPPIAAISRKRLESGNITEADMLAVLDTYEPQYVILERFTNNYSATVMDEINRHYQLVLKILPGYYYRRITP